MVLGMILFQVMKVFFESMNNAEIFFDRFCSIFFFLICFSFGGDEKMICCYIWKKRKIEKERDTGYFIVSYLRRN